MRARMLALSEDEVGVLLLPNVSVLIVIQVCMGKMFFAAAAAAFVVVVVNGKTWSTGTEMLAASFSFYLCACVCAMHRRLSEIKRRRQR